ncbi:DUF4340 domain-containing protein [Cytophaga aurantiaca]|uniref:DUF4340 domain-containing protein n=1 Tax=Cytophaga aurantiaca TaxID=29530 RepID=UPI000382D0E3|nr:DUF4340 domain-containing protein [Cytophaga aurantiaca]
MLSGITTRVKVLFLVAVVTGALAFWTSVSKDQSGKPVYAEFIAIDTTDLVKVEFTANGETHYVAPKTNNTWFIDSKYDVRKDFITTMKLGLGRMDVKMPVASEVKDEIRKRLLSEGVHVTVSTEEATKEFWVLTNDNDNNSSYYISSKDAEPYIIYVPGFTGDLTDLFKIKAGDWRNKALFRNIPGSIQEVTLKYASSPKDGFVIQQKMNSYEVVDMKSVDSTKLYTYLSLFQRVNVDNILVDKQKDSVEFLLKTQSAEVTLSIVDHDKTQSKTIQIYKALPGTKLLYAKVVDNGELVTLNPETFYRLLVRKQWFMDK